MKLFKIYTMYFGDRTCFLIIASNENEAKEKVEKELLSFLEEIESIEEINEIDGHTVIIENKKIILKKG